MSVSAIEFGLRLVSRRFRAKHPASFHLMQIGLSIMVYCSLLKSLVVRLHQRPLSSARGGTVAGENHLQGIPRLFAWVVAASAGQCVEPRTKFFIPLRRLPRPIPRSGSGLGIGVDRLNVPSGVSRSRSVPFEATNGAALHDFADALDQYEGWSALALLKITEILRRDFKLARELLLRNFAPVADSQQHFAESQRPRRIPRRTSSRGLGVRGGHWGTPALDRNCFSVIVLIVFAKCVVRPCPQGKQATPLERL